MPDRRGDWGWLLGLSALAIVVRVAAVVVLQSHTVPHSTYEHGEIAANLLAGRGFAVRFLGADGPTAQQAPVYPWLVAGAYALGGVETPRALLILQLGQAVLGGLLVVVVFWLAREIAPGRRWLARLAALIAAMHPTLVYATTHVQVAPLAAFLLTATMAAAFRAGRTGRKRHAVGAGVWLGSLALTDPILALVAPGMAWAIVLREGQGQGQGVRGAARQIARVALTAALVVSPWVVRNARVHGEFVAIKSTFGYAFWQGNCALSEGTDKVVRSSVERTLSQKPRDLRGLNATLWAARHEAGYLDDIALSPQDYRELGAVSEPERSRRLFRRAVSDLRADPPRYLRLCLRRLRYFILFDETNPKTRNLVYRASHLALTILAALGLMRAGRDVRRRLAPTILSAALIAAFHTLTIVSARFHIPIEPLLGLWAASGLAGGPLASSRITGRGPGRSTAAADHVVGIRVEPRLGMSVVRERR